MITLENITDLPLHNETGASLEDLARDLSIIFDPEITQEELHKEVLDLCLNAKDLQIQLSIALYQLACKVDVEVSRPPAWFFQEHKDKYEALEASGLRPILEFVTEVQDDTPGS